MGLDSKKAPPLPAPTETESTADDLTTDVSKNGDEKSSYELPEDGTPITIKTRGHKASRSQTSLLIEYFEGGKTNVGSSSERKPSVRVRLTPSKKSRGDHFQITETKSARKASLTRRTPVTPTKGADHDGVDDDASYASATEESNVSRNPIDIEIDRTGRRRRPASPLIPAADSKAGGYEPPNMSDISAIPTDSFLDGSGPSRTSDGKRAKSPSRGAELAAAAAAGALTGLAASKMKSSKSGTKERAVVPRTSERLREKPDKKHKSSKSRTRESEKYADDARSPRRRSSRGHHESSVLSGDSSVVSSNVSPHHSHHSHHSDNRSIRSATSKAASINNPKLLETVEDAIRRLILPELSALKREQSRREGGSRRGSVSSTGTSASREALSADRRRSAEKREERRESGKHKDRRDRESRHDYADSSPLSIDRDSFRSAARDADVDTPRRSSDKMKAALAGAAVGGLAAHVLDSHPQSPSDDKRQRRRRRGDDRSRSLGREKYSEEAEEEHAPEPPMPLMSEINPSEITRTSILSADTDRPHSASEELTPVHEVKRGVVSSDSTPTPTRTPVNLQQSLGTQHANISHGDLRTLSTRRRTGDFEDPDAKEGYEDEEVEEEEAHPEEQFEQGYYDTQDVPAPLKYEPYQPHARGLSPIYSVSGYTEGGSEAQHQRDSRVTNVSEHSSPEKSPFHEAIMHSPGSVPSNVMSREFDARSVDDRSIRSSGMDYRNTTYTDDSELDRVTSGQAVRGVGGKPNLVHVPVGVESAVASLVDGDQSVLTTGSGYDYNRDSYNEEAHSGNRSHEKHDEDYQQYDDRASTPVSGRPYNSREFAEEYDVDDEGHKVARSRYRHSPTASEAAITAGAVGAAAAALRAAAKGRHQQAAVEEEDEFLPAGVGRNKSFKQRTLEGHEPAHTPAHSVDRFEYDDQPKLGASGLPDLNDPIPEIGYMDDEITNPSVVEEPLGGMQHGNRDHWPTKATPGQPEHHVEDAYDRELQDGDAKNHHGLGITEAAGVAAIATAAAMAGSHSQRPSQELDDEFYRTSNDRKRDTLITNPYEDASPIVNPALNDNLLSRSLGNVNYGPGFHTGSPGMGQKVDEGYISQGPVRSPDVQDKGKGLDYGAAMGDDPFYVSNKHARHLSGMSQGMASPLYDAATGTGIERIESNDIIALMQHLMVRDAQRSARDTELLMTVVQMATDMRSSFDNMKKVLAETEDVVIREVQDHTEETVSKAINGPRPMPGSAARSIQGGGSQSGTMDDPTKRRNFLRRALKGLSTKGTNDLTRIEEMLMQLLTEVGTLKNQTNPGGATTGGQGQSYENIQPEGQYEQDHGYEPEGHAGTSTASIQSRGPSTKLGYERKFSDHRISTVPEANEDEYEHALAAGQYTDPNLLAPERREQRGNSVPLATPPQQSVTFNTSHSNENTPKTDKTKKHKSSSSSGWFPKISRWSETTASSVGKAFRNSGMSRKDKHDSGAFYQENRSRSGSDVVPFEGTQMDEYGDDKLHTGFSQENLQGPNQPLDLAPPRAYMTPEDPKYHAHRNSLNLQHPQPRPGQQEHFKATLESQAREFDSPMSPRSADWAGSATSLPRFAQEGEYGSGSPTAGNAAAAPPRPPKEPLDSTGGGWNVRGNRLSKLQKGSPLPHQSIESGYVTGTGTHASYSPKLENRNLSGALGPPVRRPSGPRAMTPKSAEDEAAREERRRKRDTFGTIASQDSETF